MLADETSLSLLGSDTATVENLFEFWSDIQCSLEEDISNGTATTEILALASEVASRIEVITKKFLTLYEEVEGLNSSFADMRTLFHELSLEDKPSAKIPVKHGKSSNNLSIGSIPYVRP